VLQVLLQPLIVMPERIKMRKNGKLVRIVLPAMRALKSPPTIQVARAVRVISAPSTLMQLPPTTAPQGHMVPQPCCSPPTIALFALLDPIASVEKMLPTANVPQATIAVKVLILPLRIIAPLALTAHKVHLLPFLAPLESIVPVVTI